MEIKNQVKQLPWHPTRRWASRDISKINKLIIHQELGDSSIEAVNNYHINPNHISAKGCPHFCYHFGISKNGEIIQANELSSIVWHCKGQNSVGVGIMLVGNFKGPGHELAADGPTKEQYESLEWLIKYLITTLKLSNTDVYGHYHFGKPACPGYGAQDWIESLRNQVFTEIEVKMTISEIQDRLNKLGYDAGPVDGVIGVKTLGAIRSFQEFNGLIIDGIVGPQTWKKLLSLSKK